MILLNCSNGGVLGNKVAKHLGIKAYNNIVKYFPDKEVNIKLGSSVKGKDVLIVQSLALKPDVYLIELLLTIRTVKDLGAKRIILLVPYLAYMRQDHRFTTLECINCVEIAHFINHSGADELITVDPHLHRVDSLEQIFKIKCQKVTAINDIAEYIKNKLKLKKPMIIGPDEESDQWSGEVAKLLGLDFKIYEKTRASATDVNVKVTGSFKGMDVVIVDDIISTGGTMISAAKKIKAEGAKSVHAITTHGLFLKNVAELKKVFDSIASTNTVPTGFSKIDLSKTIAGVL